jgi:hypothetical protein
MPSRRSLEIPSILLSPQFKQVVLLARNDFANRWFRRFTIKRARRGRSGKHRALRGDIPFH